MNKNLIDLKNLNIVKQIKAIRLIEDIDIDIKEFLIDQSNINIMIDICLSKDFTEIIKELAKTFPDLVANCNLSQDYFDEKIEQYFTSYKSIHHLEIICKAFLHLTPKITQIDYDKKMDKMLFDYFSLRSEAKDEENRMLHYSSRDMGSWHELKHLAKELSNQCFALATALPHLAINFNIEQEIFNNSIMDFFDETNKSLWNGLLLSRQISCQKLCQTLPANALKFPKKSFDELLKKYSNPDCSYTPKFYEIFPHYQPNKIYIIEQMRLCADKSFDNFNEYRLKGCASLLKVFPYLATEHNFSQEDFNKLMEECPKDKVELLNEAFPIMAINYIKKDKFAELR